jgi:hypothetical protein
VHEVSETTALAAQVAQIHHMMKALLTRPVLPEVIAEPIQVITDSTEVAYVYCGSAHLFEDCSANHVSINYVRNFGKNNNPFSQTYNPGRKNHPNFSWANAQNQQKPLATQPGYAA